MDVCCPSSTNPLTLAEMKGPLCALRSLHRWPLAAACCGHSTNIHDTCWPSGDIWGRLWRQSKGLRKPQVLVGLFGVKFKWMRPHDLPLLETSLRFWFFMKRPTHSSSALPRGETSKRGITGWCFLRRTSLELFVLDLATPRHIPSPVITLRSHASDPFPVMYGLYLLVTAGQLRLSLALRL